MEEQKEYLNFIQDPVRNGVATLVLGILSIVTCIFYGIPSIILGIIALAISHSSAAEYKSSPDLYDKSSYSQLNAGRICATIGVSLSVLFWIVIFIAYYLLKTNLTNNGF